MPSRLKLKWANVKSWLALRRVKRKPQPKQQDEPAIRRPSHCTSCTSRQSLMEEEESPKQSIHHRRSSASSQLSMTDIQQELEKIYELYSFALDELNYAGDSLGTFYYDNDRISAQEAIEKFSCASKDLLDLTHDPLFKAQLHSIIYPRMKLLQKNLDALPHDPPLSSIYVPS